LKNEFEMQDWRTILIHPDAVVRDAIAAIERGAVGIALVVDVDNKLLGTVTDGDVRRAILRNVPLEGNVSELLARPPGSPYARPITALHGTPDDELLALMHIKTVHQVPLVDSQGRVMDLALMSELTRRRDLSIPAVVMAGGFGTRLFPLTENTPKPLLPLGGKPILERIVEGLCSHGIRHIWLTTHYCAEQIQAHFGDGRKWDAQIRYVHERAPLGTAGALSLLPERFTTPFVLMNGDLLTRLNYRSLYRFHVDVDAVMTVCVKEYDIRVPYGVVELENGLVCDLSEKPMNRFFINAGIYVLTPQLLDYIPSGRQFNITELIQQLVAQGKKVAGFPIREYWLDIGQMPDYEQAQQDLQNGRFEN
jgi:dTDP-glucose pyrophosphorylase/CBS domain-containing protein